MDGGVDGRWRGAKGGRDGQGDGTAHGGWTGVDGAVTTQDQRISVVLLWQYFGSTLTLCCQDTASKWHTVVCGLKWLHKVSQLAMFPPSALCLLSLRQTPERKNLSTSNHACASVIINLSLLVYYTLQSKVLLYLMSLCVDQQQQESKKESKQQTSSQQAAEAAASAAAKPAAVAKQQRSSSNQQQAAAAAAKHHQPPRQAGYLS